MSKFLNFIGDHVGPLVYTQVDDVDTNGVWKNVRTSKDDVTNSDDVLTLTADTEDDVQQILFTDMQKLLQKKATEELRLSQTNREIDAMALVLGSWTPSLEV